MLITAVELETLDLPAERAFYTQTLGMPLRASTEQAFTVQAGTTALTYRAGDQQRPSLLYHFAFTVPFNTWR